MSPTGLSAAQLNSSCLGLTWRMPAESGADRFQVTYSVVNGDQKPKTVS